MSKKVILFGTAFGSLAGASLFVYFSKNLYMSTSGWGQFFFFLMMFLATLVGVTLCVFSINRDSKNTATLAQLILSGLITGTIICLIVSIIHGYIIEGQSHLMTQFLDYREAALRKRYSTNNMSIEEMDIQVNAFKEGFISKFKFFVTQYSVVASLSLLSSAITGYIIVKRRN